MEDLIDVTSISAGILSITEFTKKYVPSDKREFVLPIVSIVAGIGISLYMHLKNGKELEALPVLGAVLVGAFAGVTVSGSYRAAKEFKKEETVISGTPLDRSDV